MINSTLSEQNNNNMAGVLNFMSWNCKGVMSASPYLNNCLVENNIHFCALSEHWLRLCNIHFLQQINTDYTVYSKSVDHSNPTSYGLTNYRKGVALFVHRSLDQFILGEINIDSDRILGIEAYLPDGQRIFIFSIYLPTASQPINNFQEHVNLIHELYSVYSQEGLVILMGDFNAKIHGPRYDFEHDERSRYLETVIDDINVFSVNCSNICTGPMFTFQGYENGPTTMIDHILLPCDTADSVINTKIINDHGMNVSDHHPIICTISFKSTTALSVSRILIIHQELHGIKLLRMVTCWTIHLQFRKNSGRLVMVFTTLNHIMIKLFVLLQTQCMRHYQ